MRLRGPRLQARHLSHGFHPDSRRSSIMLNRYYPAALTNASSTDILCCNSGKRSPLSLRAWARPTRGSAANMLACPWLSSSAVSMTTNACRSSLRSSRTVRATDLATPSSRHASPARGLATRSRIDALMNPGATNFIRWTENPRARRSSTGTARSITSPALTCSGLNISRSSISSSSTTPGDRPGAALTPSSRCEKAGKSKGYTVSRFAISGGNPSLETKSSTRNSRPAPSRAKYEHDPSS